MQYYTSPFPMPIPELTTPRLRLVPVTPADLDALHRLFADPFVRRFLFDDVVIPKSRAKEEVDAALKAEKEHGVGMWIVRPLDEDELAGFVGIRPIGDTSEVEILYGFYSEFTGRGLATEATRTALCWLFASRSVSRVLGITDPANEESTRVLERLGMRPMPDYPIVNYHQLTREDFERAGNETS